MLAYIRKVADAKNRSDEGASAVEYGLLVAGIAALIVGGGSSEYAVRMCRDMLNGLPPDYLA